MFAFYFEESPNNREYKTLPNTIRSFAKPNDKKNTDNTKSNNNIVHIRLDTNTNRLSNDFDRRIEFSSWDMEPVVVVQLVNTEETLVVERCFALVRRLVDFYSFLIEMKTVSAESNREMRTKDVLMEFREVFFPFRTEKIFFFVHFKDEEEIFILVLLIFNVCCVGFNVLVYHSTINDKKHIEKEKEK